MNSQESSQLHLLLDQLVRVREVRKDPDAQALVDRATQLQPDAAYLLVQRILLLEQAIDQLKAQLQAQSAAGNNFGNSYAGTGSARSATPPGGNPSGANYQSQQAGSSSGFAAQSAPAPQQSVQPPPAGGGGSWFRNLAATAAGVAGGAFLFQGIENLMGHHNGLGGGMQSGLGGFGGSPEVVENNYFGDSVNPSLSDHGASGFDRDQKGDNGGDDRLLNTNDQDSQPASDDFPSDDSAFSSDSSWGDDSSSI